MLQDFCVYVAWNVGASLILVVVRTPKFVAPIKPQEALLRRPDSTRSLLCAGSIQERLAEVFLF